MRKKYVSVSFKSPTNSQDDRNSPSDTKDEDDASEDESDEKTSRTYDPERLKAFNVSFSE